jgi:hypothetical protein
VGAGHAGFALLYAAGLAVNTGANRAVLEPIGETPMMLTVTWVIATALSASWNFVGMRWVVFR